MGTGGERGPLITVVTVFPGHPMDEVTVTVYDPVSALAITDDEVLRSV